MARSVDAKRKPVVLMVLDGLGIAPHNPGNAVTIGKTPNLNSIWKKYPHCYLEASGNSVGLPRGVNGNSEVGHISLGAGKIMFQEIARIDYEIEHGIFFKNETFLNAIQHAKSNQGKFHLMGLVSPGKVHSSMDHLYACLEFCKREGLKGEQVVIHAFTDGRDTAPKSAKTYLEELENKIKAIDVGRIASVIGRYYAMDRDNRWERTKLAYDMIVFGKGTKVTSWEEAIDNSYKNDITDEYVEAHVIHKDDKPVGMVEDGDSVMFFNYRADRAVQLSKGFESEKPIKGWPRILRKDVMFVGFSNYEKGFVMNRASEDTAVPGGEREMVAAYLKQELKKTEDGFPQLQVFPPEKVEYCLGKILSESGLSQLRITESEKFPHVTYFFNCRNKNPYEREDRLEIPSPKDVATYDLKPQMSTVEVTNKLVEKINASTYDFYLVNYACTDMVAHTGNLDASIQAVQYADLAMGKVIDATLRKGGSVVITSDHGNVEELVNLQTGEMDTEHSTNPVPFVLASNDYQGVELKKGFLADISPTLLALMGIDKPENMIGRNLLA